MEERWLVVVGIVAIVGLLFLTSGGSSSMVVTENVMTTYNPEDYRMTGNCYVAMEQKEYTVPGKRIRFWSTHAGDSYNHWVLERNYHLCGMLKIAVKSQAHYFVCPEMTKCVKEEGDFTCIKRVIEKVKHCE